VTSNGAYTNLCKTLEVLRDELREGYILGFVVEKNLKSGLYHVWTEFNPERRLTSSDTTADRKGEPDGN
jgi:hypothetical protein